jgi:hypothetical protein
LLDYCDPDAGDQDPARFGPSGVSRAPADPVVSSRRFAAEWVT